MSAGQHAVRALRASGKMLGEVAKLILALGAAITLLGTCAWQLFGGTVQNWTDSRVQEVVQPHLDAPDPHPGLAAAKEVAAVRIVAEEAKVAASEAQVAVQRQAEPLGVLVCAQARGRVRRKTCEFPNRKVIPLDQPDALVDEIGSVR